MQQTFSFVIETLLEIFIISAAVGRRYTLTVKNFPSTYCVLHKLRGAYWISCEAHMTNETILDSHRNFIVPSETVHCGSIVPFEQSAASYPCSLHAECCMYQMLLLGKLLRRRCIAYLVIYEHNFAFQPVIDSRPYRLADSIRHPSSRLPIVLAVIIGQAGTAAAATIRTTYRTAHGAMIYRCLHRPPYLRQTLSLSLCFQRPLLFCPCAYDSYAIMLNICCRPYTMHLFTSLKWLVQLD